MKNRISIIAILSAIALLVNAKMVFGQSDTLPDFNSIRTPASPAFVILGKESSLEHSDDPSTIAASLKQLASNLNNLPSDFALEVSPYWLFKHQTLTWREDTCRTFGESFERTLTFSIATGNLGDSANPQHALSGGIKFSLLSGKTSDSTLKHLHEDETFADSMSQKIAASAQEALQKAGISEGLRRAGKEYHDAAVKDPTSKETIIAKLKLDSVTTLSESVYKGWKDSLTKAWKDSVSSPFRVATYVLARTGPFCDIAAAWAYSASQGIWDSLKFNQMAAWLTFGYEWNSWSALFSAKFSNTSDTANSKWLDVGAKAQIPVGSYEVDGEFLERIFLSANAPASQVKYDLTFNYDLGKQDWLSFKFGKDFSSNTANSIIAVAGISLNLNSLRYQSIQ